MTFKSMLVTGLMATVAMAGTLGDRAQKFNCGAPQPSKQHLAISSEFAAKEAISRATVANAQIGVYMHVVASSTTAAGGYLTVCGAAFCFLLHRPS